MLVLVDFQRINSSSGTGSVTILGLYNTDDDALYYYKPLELFSLIKKSLKANKPMQIKGLDYLNLEAKWEWERLGKQIVIEAIDGIGFIDLDTSVNSYIRRYKDAIVYSKKGKVITDDLTSCIETIFTKPMKIARFTSSMTFWYKGVKFRWQDKYKNQTTAGLNIECTLPWKSTKNYFYINQQKICLENTVATCIKTTWPSYMNNRFFIDAMNEVQQYICPITSFYRCTLPYCESLDLRGLNMQHLTKLRNCFWKSKTLKMVNIGELNLNNILDIYWAFQDDKNLEIIDFRGCKGDIQLYITDKFLCNLTRVGDSTCILLNKKQVNFAQLLKSSPFVQELVNVNNIQDVNKAKEFVIASAKLMTGKIPTLFFVRL